MLTCEIAFKINTFVQHVIDMFLHKIIFKENSL